MKAFLHHLGFEFRSGFRDRARLLMLYFFPLVFAVLMGALMGQVNPLFKDRMIQSMAVFTMMCSAFLSLPAAMVAARNSGIWRSFKINAVPRLAILVIPVIALGLHGLVVTGIIMVLAVQFFGAAMPADLLRFVLVWVVSWLAIASVGCLIGVVSANERVSLVLSQVLYIPSIMLGGLMMPDSILSPGMQVFARVFPATHAMGAFMDPGAWQALLVLGGITLAAWLLTLWRFRWEAR